MRIKVACALKGPGTLFSHVFGDERDAFVLLRNKLCDIVNADLQEKRKNNEIDEKAFHHMSYQASFDIESRKKLDLLLMPYGIRQVLTRQAAIFVIGDSLQAAIHSEPAIKEDRLFIAIIPDSVEQITHLKIIENGK